MKNMFKKAIAAASAAVLCAVPMTSSFASAASNTRKNTYRVFFDLTSSKVSAYTQFELGAYLGTTDLIGVTAWNNTGDPEKGDLRYVGGSGSRGYAKGVVNFNYKKENTISLKKDHRTMFNATYVTTADNAGGIDIKYNDSKVIYQTYLVGDADGNGKVTKSDVGIIEFVLNTDSYRDILVDEGTRAYDINNDGHITDTDAKLLRAYVNKDLNDLVFNCTLLSNLSKQ